MHKWELRIVVWWQGKSNHCRLIIRDIKSSLVKAQMEVEFLHIV
jgi:hypothetical protein